MVGLVGWLWLLVGCGPSSAPEPALEVPERPRDRDARATEELFEIPWNGGTRGAWVHVPDGITGKAPAIVMFHGGSGAGGKRAARPWMEHRNKGYVLVFPNGQTDDPARSAWSPTRGDVREQVDFTTRLLDALVARYPIDPSRVYAAGFSIGGQQVFRLACLAPDRFAGFAVVAQTMQDDTLAACKTSVSRPLLWVNGTADPRNPVNGRPADPNESSGRIGLEETSTFWRERNGCKAKNDVRVDRPDLPGDRTKVVDQTFAGCDQPFQFLRIEGGGHSWPGNQEDDEETKGSKCTDIDASDEAVAFWRKHAGL